MRAIKELFVLTAMSLKTLPQRISSSLVIVIGTAGVVGVFVCVLGLATSLSETVLATGHADRALVLSGGAAEASSVLPNEAMLALQNMSGIARNDKGEPIVSRDLVSNIFLYRRGDGPRVGIPVRGMSEKAFEVRPELKLTKGRLYRPGLREVIVGQSAQDAFTGLDLGDTIKIRNTTWTVVGVFTCGTAFESSVLTDVDTLLSAYKRTEASSLTVKLESPEAFDIFKIEMMTYPSLSVTVMKERDYYERQSQGMSALIYIVTYVVGGIMATGAIFAALNTMYSAVASRSREIATLRAIGYGATPVVLSIFIESLLLALLGGSIGALLVWLIFGNETMQTGDVSSALVFRLSLSPELITHGLLLGCLIGFIGGLFPAARAARATVGVALRTL